MFRTRSDSDAGLASNSTVGGNRGVQLVHSTGETKIVDERRINVNMS